MKRTALFPGSFNPFTRGHKSIVERTLQSLADEVVIAIGKNSGKHDETPAEERLAAIRNVFSEEGRVKVVAYDGLTADYAREIHADFIVRGIRSVKDFEYEREIADVNRRLSGIETVFVCSEPEYASISSSIVRELKSYNKDVSEFLP